MDIVILEKFDLLTTFGVVTPIVNVTCLNQHPCFRLAAFDYGVEIIFGENDWRMAFGSLELKTIAGVTLQTIVPLKGVQQRLQKITIELPITGQSTYKDHFTVNQLEKMESSNFSFSVDNNIYFIHIGDETYILANPEKVIFMGIPWCMGDRIVPPVDKELLKDITVDVKRMFGWNLPLSLGIDVSKPIPANILFKHHKDRLDRFYISEILGEFIRLPKE